MSYSNDKDSHTGPEWTNSPKTNRSNAPNQETLFEFFKQKSRRDLDKSFSSARKSRRGRSEIPDSPNVKLLKELNSSSSPNKQKRLPPTQSPRPVGNALRMPSPLKATDARLYTSKDETESVTETREQETPSTSGPLFLRLIQSGARTRTKPDVPNVPKPTRRFSATLPKDGNRLRESDTIQMHGRIVTGIETGTGTMDDFSCLNLNTKSTYMDNKRNSPPRRSPRTPSPQPRRSPARSQSPTNEIKLFGERQRGILTEASIISYIQDYEQKFAELSNYMQKQVKQVNRLTQILQRDQEDCDFFQLRILVDDLGLTTMAASKHLNDGLLEVAEVLELLDRTEQRHRHEIRELNDALDHSRVALKGGKDDNQEKLEDLLSYIEGLKGKQSFSMSRERKSYNHEESRYRHRDHVDTEAHEMEREKMRENIAQMRGVIQSLEMQVKELKRENISYKEQNISLKENQTSLKKESEALRKEAEVLKHDLNAVLLTQEREERDEFRRSSSKGLKEKRGTSRSRPNSPSKTIKKAETYQVQDPEVESLKTEVEYLKYKANTLAKDNEDLIKRLTDKVLMEREMKVLKVKVQELADIVHTKTKENETLWKVMKDAKDKLGVNGGSAFGLILKQNGLDDRNRGKLTHW